MRHILLIAAFALAVAPGITGNSGRAEKAVVPPVVLHMTAKDFEFDPPEIHVRQDAPIELHVVSTDRTHAIHISPFPDNAKGNTPPGLSFINGEDCYKLKKDEEVIIEFTGLDAGSYSFKCCKLCGSGHKAMVGKIVVDPAG